MRDIDRRRLGEATAVMLAAIAAGSFGEPPKAQAAQGGPAHDMAGMPASWRGKEKIVFLLYPGFTALDVVGPHYMLGNLMGATVEFVARTKEPLKSDMGVVVTPSEDFAEASRGVDVFCVPGGTTGTLEAMRDDATLAFIKEIGSRAKLVTSVCTGSMLLGAAGLLEGYKATSHWVTKPLLPIFGAIPASGRYVRDRNRITAEGVTAGLDFGLSLLAELRDEKYAKGVQLLAQYSPAPPFDAGEPDRAPKEVTAMIEGMFSGFKGELRETGEAAFAKLKRL